MEPRTDHLPPTNPWAFALSANGAAGSGGGAVAHGLVQFTMPFRMSIKDVAAVLKVSASDLIRWNSIRYADLTEGR